MKNKQKGIITLIAGGISALLVVAVYFLAPKTGGLIPKPDADRYSLAEIAVDTKVVARIDQYEKGLQNMMRPSAPNAGASDFGAFGDPFDPNPITGPKVGAVEGAVEPVFNHIVAMTYVTKTKRFAEIDHAFYAVGERLPDGFLIAGITKEGVSLERKGAVRRVSVSNKDADTMIPGGGKPDEKGTPDPAGVTHAPSAASQNINAVAQPRSGADHPDKVNTILDNAQKKLDAARAKALTLPDSEKMLKDLDNAQKAIDATRAKTGR